MPGQQPHSSQPWDEMNIFDAPPRPDRRKPIVRVVCPVCAAIVAVNAVEVEGMTETLCSKCENTTISVGTDDHGHIISIEGWPNVVVEKKTKKTDLKTVGPYAFGAFVLLLLFAILLRQAGTPAPTTTAPAGAKQSAVEKTEKAESQRDLETDLSAPATPQRLPFSDVLNEAPNKNRDKRAPGAHPSAVNPVTGDMFAPEKN